MIKTSGNGGERDHPGLVHKFKFRSLMILLRNR